MGRPTNEQAALSRQLAEERLSDLDSLQDDWRPCPAMRHLHPDHQRVCSECNGKICERMQAKGLNEDGTPLSPANRPVCGAKTRSGGTCSHKVIPGKIRCRFHGGKSTGPRTPEGRARIAEAQRKRWAIGERTKDKTNKADYSRLHFDVRWLQGSARQKRFRAGWKKGEAPITVIRTLPSQ